MKNRNKNRYLPLSLQISFIYFDQRRFSFDCGHSTGFSVRKAPFTGQRDNFPLRLPLPIIFAPQKMKGHENHEVWRHLRR